LREVSRLEKSWPAGDDERSDLKSKAGENP